MNVSFSDIQAAAQRIRSGIYLSPCPDSESLSGIAGCRVFCKLDNLQRTGSFKERGARNAILRLSDEEHKRGIIAASAGNHALGVARHGGMLGVPVTVVMPVFAPLAKINLCKQLGANVILHGHSFDQAKPHAMDLAKKHGYNYIHPFDNPHVIAGNGTVGLEIAEQVPDMDAVLVPVGGGGLIAGVSVVIKHLLPHVKVIGVEAENAACMFAAMQAGKPVDITVKPSLADGLSVSRIGDITFAVAHPNVEKVVTVNERAIALAILRMVELEKTVVEGAGGVGLAALMSGQLPELAGKKVVLLLSGGNIDTTVLGRIIERGLAADGRLCRFEARLTDRPGALAKLTAAIAHEGASVIDIKHERAFVGDDLLTAVVHCVVETRDHDHMRHLRDRLTHDGFSVIFPEVRETAAAPAPAPQHPAPVR